MGIDGFVVRPVQVQYVFSDKTGTLTENNMVFRRCAVGGIDYNHPALNQQEGVATIVTLS